jgi:hypothetical protein
VAPSNAQPPRQFSKQWLLLLWTLNPKQFSSRWTATRRPLDYGPAGSWSVYRGPRGNCQQFRPPDTRVTAPHPSQQLRLHLSSPVCFVRQGCQDARPRRRQQPRRCALWITQPDGQRLVSEMASSSHRKTPHHHWAIAIAASVSCKRGTRPCAPLARPPLENHQRRIKAMA